MHTQRPQQRRLAGILEGHGAHRFALMLGQDEVGHARAEIVAGQAARRQQAAARIQICSAEPGGRLAISDVVAIQPMPRELADSVEALTGCVAGSASIEDLRSLLAAAGFGEVQIQARSESRAIIARCLPGAEEYVVSATIEARKPGAKSCCAPSCCS